ncbi:MAG: DNA replication/repair protein RecF, partial [Candidatus Zixiibacteriota bacterium]
MFSSAFFLSIVAMQLSRLKATSFRNFSQIEIEAAPKVNIFYGPNGSGKTNLLEAIFLVCLGRSQRGYNDSVLLKSGTETYRVEGTLKSGDRVHEAAVAYLKGGRKQFTLNGVKSRLPDLYDHFSAVAIGPEDSEILTGPPSTRRLFLDLYISQISRKYLEELSRYNRILAQKNAALRNGLEFSAFNDLMLNAGTAIMKGRVDFLKGLKKHSVDYYYRFSGGSSLAIKYAPTIFNETEWDEKMVETEFEKRLDANKEKEKILKTAIIGPHRDEVEFSINDLPARTHGSQGESRSIAIALKLAVYN